MFTVNLCKKKLFFIILVILTMMTSLSALTLGDVNTSDTIDIVDALLIAQYNVGISVANFNSAAADVDADGSISIVDALLVAQYATGLINQFPGSKTPTPTPTFTPTPSSLKVTTVQAEIAFCNDAVVESEYPGYTGSGYVNTANALGTYLEWPLTTFTSGDAIFSVTYANGSTASRPMEIRINNNVVVASLDFPATGSWDTWKTVSTILNLVNGNNTVRFTSLTADGAPNLDKLDISFNGYITYPVPTAPPASKAIGWGSVNYLGQNGTYGGAGGETVDVYDIAALKNAISDNTPRTVIIHGSINTGTPQQLNVYSNKTIIGAGNGAYLDFGFYMRGNNIILQNLDIWNGGTGDTEGYDGISWAVNLHHFWIDHCTFHECMDGAVDPTRNVRFVTISYCRFYSQNKTLLIGASDDDPNALAAQSNSDKREWHYTVTVHHCWFQQTSQRHPRVRFGAVHVFNNYYDNLGSYAIGRGDRANIYSEANYFYNAKAVFSAYDDSGNPGYVDDVNSLFEGSNSNTGDNPPSGSWVWRPSQYYSYTAHSASWVKSNLKNYAGAGKANP